MDVLTCVAVNDGENGSASEFPEVWLATQQVIGQNWVVVREVGRDGNQRATRVDVDNDKLSGTGCTAYPDASCAPPSPPFSRRFPF